MREAFEPDAVRRPLVVERERVAVVPDASDAGRPFDEARGRRRRPPLERRGRAIRGSQRILPEVMLQVGQQQLLVLLLVMQSELDEVELRGGEPARGQPPHDAVVDDASVVEHLVEPGPRHEPALVHADAGRRRRRSTS